MDAIRSVLDPWLGEPQRKRNDGGITLIYRFDSEGVPPIPLRLKVEMNSREHFTVHGPKSVPFGVTSRWFDGSGTIQCYELDELLGTKLRALYQRKQGRDLFDLANALAHPRVDPARVVAAFSAYMAHGGRHVTRAQFEQNIARKLRDPMFRGDITPLLATGFRWEIEEEARSVSDNLIARLPGAPWKGEPYVPD